MIHRQADLAAVELSRQHSLLYSGPRVRFISSYFFFLETFMKRINMLFLLVSAIAFMGITEDSWAQYQTGDVFVSVGNGKVKRFDQNGNLLQVLDNGRGGSSYYTTGGVFDASGNFYVTTFSDNRVSKWDNSGSLINASYVTGFNANCESMSRDAAGNLYVGVADGSRSIYRITSSGTSGSILTSWVPTTGPRGTDWIDLQSNQTTFYIGSEGSSIRAFDMSGSNAIFANAPVSTNIYAVRTATNGDVFCAATNVVYRFNSSGTLIQTYSNSSLGFPQVLFALNLDPDGTSFWTADLNTGRVIKVDMSTGSVLKSWNSSPYTLTAGLAIYGEITAAVPRCTPTEVSSDPSDQTLCAGSTASFSAAASETPTVQWQLNTGSGWSDISGATSTTYSFTAAASQNGYQYRAIFSQDTCNSDTTAAATLTVNSAPSVTSSPSNADVCNGASASFSASASGATSTQWQVSTDGTNWSDISGETSGTYSISTAACGQRGSSYRVAFTNSCGTTYSDAASLNVRCGCAHTIGYWKNHDGQWTTVVIGSHTLSHAQALAYLNSPATNKWYILVNQLIAEYLNATVNNACYSCISSTVTAANNWVNTYWTTSCPATPPTITGSSAAWSAGQPLSSALDSYNNGNSSCATTCN
jgi:outer membrane protein assembly factor BamB